ncbi:uncharacterized protein LOC123660607 [Melitaea cinxia]|uniref:uncharacterized protein LOC123660607 n=1 Tax=Melitaea cinxia TaxID=113334 RepID=UPI001E270530|nr:uncharacterized protein LOC123660607 [Melitaea cinxia]
MSQPNAYTDVVELCALLQCLGFGIKSLETTDVNVSQDEAIRTVVINCQASGFHVVMESANTTCSCPLAPSHQNSGFWEVSGVTGGKQYSKECGSALLGSLPKAHRERLTKQLQDIVRYIKEYNESEGEKHKECLGNKSASMLDLKTPEKRHNVLKTETPTRYRSLDTLTTAGNTPGQLPAPGPLLKDTTDDNANEKKMQLMCQRQSTYTLSSTPGSSQHRNKTSSPIQVPFTSIVENLLNAEKMAEALRTKIANVLKDFVNDDKHEDIEEMSSLVLDVSKISVIKGTEPTKLQFSSSPNLSGLGVQDEFMKRLKRVESASTSNLAKSKAKDEKTSKLRRLSPNIFKLRNSPSVAKSDSNKTPQENKSSRLNSLFKPKVVTPVRIPKKNDASINLSGSKKKYSNVKSTIPRPASKKE